MNILVITPYYIPDLGPSAPLFEMLCEELAKRGHQVSVISAVPHYPLGIVQSEFRGKWIKESKENEVNVIRVAVPSLDRSNLNKRLLQFICYQIGATWASLFRKFDVVIITNPSIEILVPFTWHRFFRRKPIVYSVFDLYPDVGVKLGLFKSPIILKIVTYLEKFCLSRSSITQIISEKFKPSLRILGIPDTKIVLLNLWVDTNLIKPLSNQNAFSLEYKFENDFIVLYAGNIGFSQGLENILLSAESLKEMKELQFVFVGAGSGLEHLKNQASQMQLKNVQFIPFQPRERLPEVLASAGVSLVILKRGIGADSLPSKTFSILASGRPIIASVDEESETWNLIKKAEAGLCVPPEDPEKIAEAILSLKNNKELRETLGKNGRIWAEKHHSPQHAVEQFEDLCQKAISVHKQKNFFSR